MREERADQGYPTPTSDDLNSSEFAAVWLAIRHWDIQRTPAEGYAHATGNDVMHVLLSLRQAERM